MVSLTPEEINICRASALSAINGFIQSSSNAKPLSATDFTIIIDILRSGNTKTRAKVKAMKYLRRVTGMTKSIPWHVPVADEGNNFQQYLHNNKLEYTWLPHEVPNMDLKNILYIVKFIQANLSLLAQ